MESLVLPLEWQMVMTLTQAVWMHRKELSLSSLGIAPSQTAGPLQPDAVVYTVDNDICRLCITSCHNQGDLPYQNTLQGGKFLQTNATPVFHEVAILGTPTRKKEKKNQPP